MDSFVIKSSQIAISPQKMNLVAGLIRKKELNHSLTFLAFLPKKGGRILYKLLQGAAKSLTKKKENANDFYLDRVEINQVRTQKRVIYRAKGRADRIRKRYCLINLRLTKKKVNKVSSLSMKEQKEE
jgi:large subunit ribosomal protein L22